MALPEFHEFFVATAGVAGALIGLLFVAISVAPDKVLADDAERRHQVRALAALTSFTNALAVSLFALIPQIGLGGSVISIGILGLVFVIASTTALVREAGRHWLTLRDQSFLIGLTVIFAFQVLEGARLVRHPANVDATSSVCVLVAVCFFVGISRSWELIGGPSIHLRSELTAAFRERAADPLEGSSDDDEDQRGL
jgi:hypothetical protein